MTDATHHPLPTGRTTFAAIAASTRPHPPHHHANAFLPGPPPGISLLDHPRYDIEADGRTILVETDAADSGTLFLRGPAAGNIVVVGPGTVSAYRTGTGIGDARREGSGYGDAVRYDGRGDALRDGAGTGNAVNASPVYGRALRAGSGAGDALRRGSGDGSAHRIGAGPGSAVCLGISAAANCRADRYDEGRGDAFNSTPGSGHALRDGDGAGDAVRLFGAAGNAVRSHSGHGDAIVDSPAGKALPCRFGDGRGQELAYRPLGPHQHPDLPSLAELPPDAPPPFAAVAPAGDPPAVLYRWINPRTGHVAYFPHLADLLDTAADEFPDLLRT